MANSLTKPKKQLSHKYVLITFLVSLVGLVILAVLLITFIKEFYGMTMETQLQEIADNAHSVVLENIKLSKDGFSVNQNEIKKAFNLLARGEANYTTILFTYSDKNIMISAGYENDIISIQGLPYNLQVDEHKKGYFGAIKMGGNYKEDDVRYIASYPIVSDFTEEGGEVKTTAYIFVLKTDNLLKNFLNEFLKIYILTAIGVLALIYTVVVLTIDKVMNPLAEMALVTRQFAKSDFSKRVPIYGNGTDELSHLSIAINNMAASLDTHEQTRKSFIANVSHELRTPMTTISGFVDGVLDGTIPKERHEEYLKVVSGETKRLSRMIVSMLNISKIEAGELQINPTVFDINQTVVQTVFSFEQRINQKNLEVRGLDVKPQMVLADTDMIHQVVYNIVDNAIKFANDDGYLEFRYEKEKRNVLIGIRNSGEGLSDEEISQIFDRFYKVDRSRGINKEGVGLGLFIVRSIINLHNGEIIVNSVEGEYTEFIFSLPDETVDSN